jgi:hypothetical protein
VLVLDVDGPSPEAGPFAGGCDEQATHATSPAKVRAPQSRRRPRIAKKS